MKTALLAALAATTLTGCESFLDGQFLPEMGRYDSDLSNVEQAELATYRAYADAFSEAPFQNGAVSVVAEAQGDLGTYSLHPCRNGTAVCAGSAQGPVGQVGVTDDYTVVSGLYGGTFWLSPGGDGAFVRGGETVALAWN